MSLYTITSIDTNLARAKENFLRDYSRVTGIPHHRHFLYTKGGHLFHDNGYGFSKSVSKVVRGFFSKTYTLSLLIFIEEERSMIVVSGKSFDECKEKYMSNYHKMVGHSTEQYIAMVGHKIYHKADGKKTECRLIEIPELISKTYVLQTNIF